MIELSNVALLHPRDGSPLVSDATMAVARGQVVLVVASAGLGSSRLMAAMLGEADCAAGAISMLGHDVGKLRRASLRKLRRRIGIVPQDLCLLEDRSVQLNVVMPLEIDGVPRSASLGRAEEILDQLALSDEATLDVDVLSRSARQRVAVARALIRRPDVILADHPTSDQDAAGAALVCLALDQAAAAGAACIVFSRDPMLRIHAESAGWEQWLLDGGQLAPLHRYATQPDEEIAVAFESSPSITSAPAAARTLPFGSPTPPSAPPASPQPTPLTPSLAAAVAAFEASPEDSFANVLPFPGAARAGAR
jgi:cell division transport system ATP-binding protein